MSYEVFTRKVVRTGAPAISINRMGRVGLNQSATEILKKHGIEFLLLLYDKDKLKMAIKATSKTDSRAYRPSFSKKGGGASFSAKTFFAHIKYETLATQSFTAEWNSSEKMFEIELMTIELQTTKPPRRKPGRPRKETVG